MVCRIDKIEGIGPAYARKLASADVTNRGHRLAQAATAAGRKKLSAASGITGALILKWANHAGLMRILGIGPQFSELLEGSGVDTVKELRKRNADNLAARMAQVRTEEKLTRVSPPVSVIQRWIDAAKALKPVISH